MSWDTNKDRPWCKMHDRWFTSPSHIGLSSNALLVGLRCMSIANRRGRQPDGSGLVVDGAGEPLGITEIGRQCHLGRKATKSALEELVKVGTMMIRGDACYGFVNLRKWQESRSPRAGEPVEFDSKKGRIKNTIRRSEDQRSLDQRSEADPTPVDLPPASAPAKDDLEPDGDWRYCVRVFNEMSGLSSIDPDFAASERNLWQSQVVVPLAKANRSHELRKWWSDFVDRIATDPLCQGKEGRMVKWSFFDCLRKTDLVHAIKSKRWSRDKPPPAQKPKPKEVKAVVSSQCPPEIQSKIHEIVGRLPKGVDFENI